MANNTINIKALAEEFKVECKVIKLGYEYPGYTGIEKYAIVTDLSYAQIMGRYVKVDIYFTAIGLIDIPTEDEIKSLMAKIKANPQEYRLTA